jgi:poly(3-hydroxybutyrate) depolymerase
MAGIMIEEFAYAQLAKVHRKVVQLKVEPSVLTKGHTIAVTVQKFMDVDGLRLVLTTREGEILLQIPFNQTASVISQSVEIPEMQEGELRVLVEAETDGVWRPVADQTVANLPDYCEQLESEIRKIESIEKNAPSDSRTLRAAWATLAFAEDMRERMKSAGAAHVKDLKQRLDYLKAKTKELESGATPSESKAGYQLRGYRSKMNGEMQLYSLYVPQNYEETKSWPLVVMLHGAWSNHHLALRRVLGLSNNRGEDDPSAKKVMPKLPDVPYFVVAPNGYETMSYEGFAEEDVWKVMDEVSFLFSIDPDRVYLTGLSMGGGGTGKLGFRNPDRFAALAPVCGFFDPRIWRDYNNDKPEFLKRLEMLSSTLGIAENLLHVPVKIMHGDQDPVVPPQGSVDLHDKLQKLGYNSALEMYAGVDHAAWVPAYENARIFEWFSQFKRDPNPKKVIFKTGNPYGGIAYWITVDEPQKIRFMASVTAEVNDNGIEITTDNVARLSLQLQNVVLPTTDRILIQIDGQKVYQGTAPESELCCVFEDGAWKMTTEKPEWRLLAGMKGLHSAMDSRHVYVYGEAGSEKEIVMARTLAVEKSLPGGNADVRWQVLPEGKLSRNDIAKNNLVLFASINGSTYLHKHLRNLPLKVNGNDLEFAGRRIANNQALAFIYPNPENPKRYLVVYTAASAEGLQALRPVVSSYDSIRGQVTGDFMVYGRDGKPLWGGLFDKDWNVEIVENFSI